MSAKVEGLKYYHPPYVQQQVQEQGEGNALEEAN